MTHILSSIPSLVLFLVYHFSYAGIVLLMAIESANIPIPSELIMPTAGYLVAQGVMNLHLAAFCGAIGCTIGSIGSYLLGRYGGRPFLERYGKFFLLTHHDLDVGDQLFKRFGDGIAFISRLLPIIRTFISFPAGVSEMNMGKFILYSFVGSWLWSYFLVFVGIKIGQNRDILTVYFHKFDLAIGIILFVGIAGYIYTHVHKLHQGNLQQKDNGSHS